MLLAAHAAHGKPGTADPQMTLPRRAWSEMTTLDFADPGVGRWIAILPVAAIEQHGPHLPVEVDACINAGIIRHMLEILPAELPVTVLPPMPVGKSNEHLAFPAPSPFRPRP
jgi:creatinine amidohydrolase